MRFSSSFVCQQCGYVSPSYLGKCPNCQSWNSFVETVVQVGKKDKGTGSSRRIKSSGAKPVKLSEISSNMVTRIPTGNVEIDLVLGGGIVPGMAVLVSGEPGIGKSTLLLQLADKFGLTSKSAKVLYVAGEESAGQIKIRAQRLGIKSETLEILEETDVDAIVTNIDDKLGLVIVDSIQTLTTDDLSGSAGSVGQVRECASRLIAACKSFAVPIFLVGHVTKEGTIAGPKILEHMVDTVLAVEGEKYSNLRLVRANKNRFGPTDEVGVLEMVETGLQPVKNLNDLFTESSDLGKPGSCLTIALEGSRPILAEIQALVTSTPLPSPRRVASGVDYNRLQTIIAIVIKRMGIPLYKEDVYVSVAGGLSISEPAADLSIALAIVSSFKGKAVASKTVAFGELDLLGNVRKVSSQARREKEATKLGFKRVLSSENLRSIGEYKL